MEKIKFFTKFDYQPVKFEEDWKTLPNLQLVRPLTLEQQIERFQAAGKKIEEMAGLGVYDFDSAVPLDDSLEDPTRDPDFDIIDAATIQRDLQLKQQASDEAGTETQSQGQDDDGSSNKDVVQNKSDSRPPQGGAQDPAPQD